MNHEENLLRFSNLDETFTRAEIALKSAKRALHYTRECFVSEKRATADYLRLKELADKFTGQANEVTGQVVDIGFMVTDADKALAEKGE